MNTVLKGALLLLVALLTACDDGTGLMPCCRQSEKVLGVAFVQDLVLEGSGSVTARCRFRLSVASNTLGYSGTPNNHYQDETEAFNLCTTLKNGDQMRVIMDTTTQGKVIRNQYFYWETMTSKTRGRLL